MRRRKRKNNVAIKVIILAVIAIFAVLAIWNVSIKSKKPEASNKATTTATEKPKTVNKWVKKDGKSYYYGEDGKIVTGRFVIKKDKKIYYTDKNGALTRTVDGTKPMIAITYDDGPSQFSADFAKLFDDNNSAATFFEVGSRIKEIPSLEKQEQAIADSNSELANHTYDHVNLTRVSTEKIKKELNKNNKVFRKYGETADPILFRAPEGAVNESVKKNCDAPVILWSVDTLDWKYRKANHVYKVAKKAKDGDIILMHSLYESSLKASKRLVPELIEKGYQLVTVTDLAEFRGGFKNGEKYFSFPPVKEEEEEATTQVTNTDDSTSKEQ